MSAVLRRIPLMDVDEFLRWEPEDGQRYELVDGEPRAMAPTSNVHGYLLTELGRLIANYLRERSSPCDVIGAPGVVPHVLSARNVRIPDLGVTCGGIKPGQSVMDEPLLLIEILSPSNGAKTWSNIWAYTSIPSVAELVVLGTETVAAEVLRRDPAGHWPERPELVLADADLVLSSIAFGVPMRTLYGRTGLVSG